MKIRPAFVAVLIGAAVLTACSQSAQNTPAAANSAAAAPAANTPAKPKTAEEVTKAIIAKVPSVSLIKTYTASDDPNHLLGRPGSYESKTAFADSRVPADQLDGTSSDAVERGGSIEVFPDAAGAKARSEQIQAIAKAMPAAVEYDYMSGGVLVRVGRYLTPDQAKEYEAALKAVLG